MQAPCGKFCTLVPYKTKLSQKQNKLVLGSPPVNHAGSLQEKEEEQEQEEEAEEQEEEKEGGGGGEEEEEEEEENRNK